LERSGLQARIYFPPSFMLTAEMLVSYMGSEPIDLLIILDKGTFAEYGTFHKYATEVMVIDHHPPQGKQPDIFLFNPCLVEYNQASTSLLIHMINTLLGGRSLWSDFINLIGLKGDFAIEPVMGFIAPFCAPFYHDVSSQFPGLLETRVDKPTLFDVEQREKTTGLSQITELAHVVCGGGFQFFYHERDPELAQLDEPMLLFKNLSSLKQNSEQLRKLATRKDFLRIIPDNVIFKRIFDHFEQDWADTFHFVDQAIPVAEIKDTVIFFFAGSNLKLLPMIGSVKSYQFKENSQAGEVIGLYLNVTSNRIQLSARGTGSTVNCGLICRTLAERVNLVSKGNRASGGGHPKAAECVMTDLHVPVSSILKELFTILLELEEL
ncbi:hypothetical protein ACFL27_14885, partial [candidate division CSSED10-310 bacterium]